MYIIGENIHIISPRVKEALGRFVNSRDPMPYLPQGMKEPE